MHPRNITYGKFGDLTVSQKYTFGAFRQMFPEGNPRPYKILETYQTSEGLRSRICSGNYASIDEAIAAIEKLSNGKTTGPKNDTSDFPRV